MLHCPLFYLTGQNKRIYKLLTVNVTVSQYLALLERREYNGVLSMSIEEITIEHILLGSLVMIFWSQSNWSEWCEPPVFLTVTTFCYDWAGKRCGGNYEDHCFIHCSFNIFRGSYSSELYIKSMPLNTFGTSFCVFASETEICSSYNGGWVHMASKDAEHLCVFQGKNMF